MALVQGLNKCSAIAEMAVQYCTNQSDKMGVSQPSRLVLRNVFKWPCNS